jgi:2Fe-2S ferredoxin
MADETVKIQFSRGGRAPLEVPAGSTLMTVLLDAGLPVASSCRGDGVCAKCRIQIPEGRKNLSPENDLEKHLRERHGFDKIERVSCQVQVLGDITIDASYW